MANGGWDTLLLSGTLAARPAPGVAGRLYVITDSTVARISRDDGTAWVDVIMSAAGIGDAAVTYAKLQDVSATARLLGRITAGAGEAEELTGTQATTLLDAFTSALKGLAPASGGGTSNFLRADGTWALPPGGGGGASATTIERDLGTTPTWRGTFTITDAAITTSSKVLCWQASGPYTGKGTRADEAELAPVSVIAVEPANGSAVVKWETPPMVVWPIASNAPRVAAAGSLTTLDVRATASRIGKLRGKVKFSYQVLA